MNKISEQIQRLQALLEHKGEVGGLRPPRSDRSAQVSQGGSEVAAVFDESPAPAEPILSKQVDPNKRPASLEGFSYGEILLFKSAGTLTPDEEKWLSTKRLRISVSKNEWML